MYEPKGKGGKESVQKQDMNKNGERGKNKVSEKSLVETPIRPLKHGELAVRTGKPGGSERKRGTWQTVLRCDTLWLGT